MTNQFEFSSLDQEELEFDRDSHNLKLQEIYDILTSGLSDNATRHRALGVLLRYRRAETPFDAYVQREDYDIDVKMIEEERDEAIKTVDERDGTINTLEYDLRDIRGELQAMEEERDMALLNLENAQADVDRLKGEVDAAEQDAHEAWDRVAELETS